MFIKILSTFFILALVVLSGLLVATMLPITGNYAVKIVQSGSMEPFISTGSIVVVAPQSTYTTGDVITFGKDTKRNIPTTHRIVEVKGSGSQVSFVTKGDANDSADQNAVKAEEVIGAVQFSIPRLGYLIDFARTPLGFSLLVVIPALTVALDEMLKIYREVVRMRARKRRALRDRFVSEEQNLYEA